MKYPASKILLIATRQIGDVLLATPLLRSLRNAYPQARIDALVYAGKSGMLQGNPDLNRVIEIAEHPSLPQYVELSRQIIRRYDLAVSTLSGDRPLAYSVLAAPRRVGLTPPPRWQDSWKRAMLHAHAELDNINTHTVIQNLRLADALEIPRCYEVVPPSPPQPGKVAARLPFREYAVLHLLPMWQYKRWTLAGWQALARYLREQRGLPLVLTGGAGEREYLDTVDFPAPCLNLAGRLNFGEVAELLRGCALYVGPDTAVTHLAAAAGAKTVALFGPTNPVKWSPWPHGYAQDANPFLRRAALQRVGNVALVQGTELCVPCHQEGCERHKNSHSLCLDRLAAESVITAVEELLAL
jgi:heptosyltransferase-3